MPIVSDMTQITAHYLSLKSRCTSAQLSSVFCRHNKSLHHQHLFAHSRPI